MISSGRLPQLRLLQGTQIVFDRIGEDLHWRLDLLGVAEQFSSLNYMFRDSTVFASLNMVGFSWGALLPENTSLKGYFLNS